MALLAKPFGLANQMLCHIQIVLNIEQFAKQDKECS